MRPSWAASPVNWSEMWCLAGISGQLNMCGKLTIALREEHWDFWIFENCIFFPNTLQRTRWEMDHLTVLRRSCCLHLPLWTLLCASIENFQTATSAAYNAVKCDMSFISHEIEKDRKVNEDYWDKFSWSSTRCYVLGLPQRSRFSLASICRDILPIFASCCHNQWTSPLSTRQLSEMKVDTVPYAT